MGRFLILGVNGQDGSYLLDNLLARGHDVIGVGRQPKYRWGNSSGSNFKYESLDLNDTQNLSALLDKYSPSVIYHFAAVHGAAGFHYEGVWREAQLVNTFVTNMLLEYARLHNRDCRIIYASSVKSLEASQSSGLYNEQSIRSRKCIYSITKNAAEDLINYYRIKHGIKASILWFGNHESIRRGYNFFIPKVLNILRKSLKQSDYHETIQKLAFWCDWGCAEEYMDITISIGENFIGEDFLVGTGNTISGYDYVQEMFEIYELKYQQHIKTVEQVDEGFFHKQKFHLEIDKLVRALGSPPKRSIFDLSHEILSLQT